MEQGRHVTRDGRDRRRLSGCVAISCGHRSLRTPSSAPAVLTALWRFVGPRWAIMGSGAAFFAAHLVIYAQPWLLETLAHWGTNAGVLAAEALLLVRHG